MKAKEIIIANDHAAFALKSELMQWLITQDYRVKDLGVGLDEKGDYPDKAEEACRLFLNGGGSYGILCCGTGLGMSIAANKIRGIRCALPQNIYAAGMAREHNNCQFIAFGGRIDYPESPVAMLEAFLKAEFNKGRHAQRVDKIRALEDS